MEGEGGGGGDRAGEEQRLVVDRDGDDVRFPGENILNRGIQLLQRCEEVVCPTCFAARRQHDEANRVVVSHGPDGARRQQRGVQMLR